MNSKNQTPPINRTSTKGWFSDNLELLITPTQRALIRARRLPHVRHRRHERQLVHPR